jgi:methyl-accepting chemotaxis protein
VVVVKRNGFGKGSKKFRMLKVRSVRSRLIVSFMAILLVPSICIGYFSFLSAKQELRNKIADAAKSNVELVNKTIDQYITPVMRDADLLAGQLSAAAVDKQDPAARKLIEGLSRSIPSWSS